MDGARHSTSSLRSTVSLLDGTRCPVCVHRHNSVVDSRDDDQGARRRRRRCDTCNTRWTTMEISRPLLEDILESLDSLRDVAASASHIHERVTDVVARNLRRED